MPVMPQCCDPESGLDDEGDSDVGALASSDARPVTGGQELCGLCASLVICFDSDDLVPTYRPIIG